jgi:hypothetical protein
MGLLADHGTVEASEDLVRWTRFEQPYRPQRDYSGFGQFAFQRNYYARALDEIADAWSRGRS